jgi:enamine deaminase RidA (YjgF/YER057c/UK114 family)
MSSPQCFLQDAAACCLRAGPPRRWRRRPAYGLDFRQVVKENVYTTDLDSFIRNKNVRKDFYGTDFPAATWVQVQRLYLPSFVVEIEVTTTFPK